MSDIATIQAGKYKNNQTNFINKGQQLWKSITCKYNCKYRHNYFDKKIIMEKFNPKRIRKEADKLYNIERQRYKKFKYLL